MRGRWVLRENAFCVAKKADWIYITTFDACIQYCESNQATILVSRNDKQCACCHTPPGQVRSVWRQYGKGFKMYQQKSKLIGQLYIRIHARLFTFVMLCYLLLPNFYLLISGRYYLKAANDLCPHIQLISTLDECKLAVRFVKDTGLNIVFHGSRSSPSWPKGCIKVESRRYAIAIWNTHHLGSARWNAQPICKQSGE